MYNLTAVWLRPDVERYAEWLRDITGDRDVYAFAMIRGIHKARHGTAEEKTGSTVAILAALSAVEVEQREARP